MRLVERVEDIKSKEKPALESKTVHTVPIIRSEGIVYVEDKAGLYRDNPGFEFCALDEPSDVLSGLEMVGSWVPAKCDEFLTLDEFEGMLSLAAGDARYFAARLCPGYTRCDFPLGASREQLKGSNSFATSLMRVPDYWAELKEGKYSDYVVDTFFNKPKLAVIERKRDQVESLRGQELNGFWAYLSFARE